MLAAVVAVGSRTVPQRTMASQQFLAFLDRFSKVFRESLGGLSMCVGLLAGGESVWSDQLLHSKSGCFHKTSDA
ncbi:hypothetical protein B9J09_09795 [Xylella fastidiosa subsp. pauca]|nr:hypothetical protein B9J09_09795 [Xylella fastidiosa subsp. pauca]TNW22173.1 hypothetical protein EIP73_03760 [Xylella fastidiosa subsp. pauca]TNW26164.1 hypothetical protein EIP74_07380 [Xylella fastidiosa subsp. pauca]